ncbi:MAG TPA: pitrilysin family protein, partial [Ignavibacteriaceae bacterium]|nr:pitrilysin family protein [Ignavibacteriaceae bacterium]
MKNKINNSNQIMRTAISTIILTLVFCSFTFAQFQLPPYEKFTLPNGLTVYLMEQHEVPLIYVSAIFPAGATKDGLKNGLAALTAESLVFGTENYTKDQIEQIVDFNGSVLNTSASLEYSAVSSYFLKDKQNEFLPLIKEVITNPVFPEDEFEKRKQRWLVELDQEKESPQSVINAYFKKFIYENDPYGNPVSGTKTSVNEININDLKNFYKIYYKPEGSAISVVGDFSIPEMKEKISELFKNWMIEKTKTVTDIVTEFPNRDKSRILLVNKDDSHETTFYIGQYGIIRNNPDFTLIQVINTILGGRFTSWLNSALRINSGLSYGAGSYFSSNKNSGTFIISSFTETASTEKAIDLALKVLDSLHTNGLDEETLNSAKNYLKGQFPPDYETSQDLASLLVRMFFYNISDS